MPATPWPKVIALVEGMMERLFINNNFSYVDLVPLTNGNGWTVEAICEQIASKYYVKNANPDYIVVWLDKEKQQCQAQEFREKIVEALMARGADPNRIHVCLPDRMTENVILADEDMIREYFNNDNYAYEYEGQNGKHVLRGMFKARGEAYKETSQGVLLLKKVRLERARKCSPCVEAFVHGFAVDCWWIGEEAA